jgi:soluble lytic murein transglycosylase-like protein
MKYKIEPSLVSALIKVESNWDHKAVSQRGAKGLMQLMPSTAKDMNVFR